MKKIFGMLVLIAAVAFTTPVDSKKKKKKGGCGCGKKIEQLAS